MQISSEIIKVNNLIVIRYYHRWLKRQFMFLLNGLPKIFLQSSTTCRTMLSFYTHLLHAGVNKFLYPGTDSPRRVNFRLHLPECRLINIYCYRAHSPIEFYFAKVQILFHTTLF